MLFFEVRPTADPNIFFDTLVQVPARIYMYDIICIGQIFVGSPREVSEGEGLFLKVYNVGKGA